MGRPPIGKVAMTSAERQRRFLARIQAQAAKKGDKPDAERCTNDAELAALKAELAQATTRIAKLEAENATLAQARASQSAAASSPKVTELRQQLDAANKENKELLGKNMRIQLEMRRLQKQLAGGPSKAEMALQYEVDSLRRKVSTLQATTKAKPPNLSEDTAELQRQLKGARTRIQKLTAEKRFVRQALDEARTKGAVIMERSERLTIVKCLHPDQLHPDIKAVLAQHPELARQHLEASQIFNALFKQKKLHEVSDA